MAVDGCDEDKEVTEVYSVHTGSDNSLMQGDEL